MAGKKIKLDLSFLSHSPWVSQLSKQWTGYEHKVKELVSDVNLKSRDAREKSKLQLDKFTAQVKQTRSQVEKKVTAIVNQEAKVLNKGLTDLLNYLKSVSKHESAVEEPVKKAPLKTKATKTKATKTVAAGAKKVSTTKTKAKTGAKRQSSLSGKPANGAADASSPS